MDVLSNVVSVGPESWIASVVVLLFGMLSSPCYEERGAVSNTRTAVHKVQN